ncbi:hypothetical protein [Marinobacterium litorale]|uniref:hypothetical protein n=1 Tax=Marinobacterium litorale TaxID=404770 RepID=UPI0004068372|nr:hypothetical protein [Marinobacterium litorale]
MKYLQRDLENPTFHPLSEQLVDVLCERVENDDRLFFRVLVSYVFSKVAAMMRTSVDTTDKGNIPVSQFVLMGSKVSEHHL